MMTPESDLYALLEKTVALKPTASVEGSAVEQRELLGNPDASKPVTLRNLFHHHDAHPVTIDFALLKSFGTDWFVWEKETLWHEIREVFSDELSQLAKSKIRSLQALHVSAMPWTKWQVFEKVCQGVNNRVPDFYNMQVPQLEQLYAAIDIMGTVGSRDWSDEVKLYMSGAVLLEDVFYVPPPLDFIQVEVSQPYYHCKDCGTKEPALFHDGLCSVCTGRMHPLQGLTLEPIREKVAAGQGKNVELILKYDPAPVQARWEEVRNKSSAEVGPTLDHLNYVDVQIGKLLLARDYMNLRRRQLAEQLTTLKSWLGAAS